MSFEYLRTKERYKEGRKESNARRRREQRAFLITLKETTPCTDCGNMYPHYIMEFDHKEKKSYNIGQLLTSTKMLLVELAKCDIVCANCHAARTHKRRQISTPA